MDKEMPKRIRMENDTPVMEIAKGIGISQSAYRNKEKGVNPWNFEEIERLAEFYGVEINAFISGYSYQTGLIMKENKALKEKIRDIAAYTEKVRRDL